MVHALPLEDQVRGAAVQQVLTRLGIPMGMGITTAIWGSYSPAPKEAFSPSDGGSLTLLHDAYFFVFVATLCFSGAALLVSPFACVGKLGVASTASERSIPQMDSGLGKMNHDGANDLADEVRSVHTPWAKKRDSQVIRARTSAGANSSFRLSRMSEVGVGLGAGSPEDERKSQRDSTAIGGRVIWLVCEDCGSSKRMVEPVGDPERYFYDGATSEDKNRPSTPLSPTPVYDEAEKRASVGTGARRFALVKG